MTKLLLGHMQEQSLSSGGWVSGGFILNFEDIEVAEQRGCKGAGTTTVGGAYFSNIVNSNIMD